jgi:NDP-sugar pyrophosphorylase family protein
MQGPSLERDVFQALAPGTIHGVTSDAPFIDIGTPDDLARAEGVLAPFSLV